MNDLKELSAKIYPNLSDKGKQAINNINAAFDEVQALASIFDATVRKTLSTPSRKPSPPDIPLELPDGIVHGAEYVITKAEYKAKRDMLDKHYESEGFDRKVDANGNVVINIRAHNPFDSMGEVDAISKPRKR